VVVLAWVLRVVVWVAGDGATLHVLTADPRDLFQFCCSC